MNVNIWAIGTLNQLFIRGFYTQIFKKISSPWQKSVSYDKSIFYSHSICLNIGFWPVLYGYVALPFLS